MIYNYLAIYFVHIIIHNYLNISLYCNIAGMHHFNDKCCVLCFRGIFYWLFIMICYIPVTR